MNTFFYRISISLGALSALLLIGLLDHSASAQTVYVPTPSLAKDKMAAGLSISPYRRKIHSNGATSNSLDYSRESVFLDYGLDSRSDLHFEVGLADLDDMRGMELAAGYYGRLGSAEMLERRPLHKGYFAVGRWATLDSGKVSGTLLQIDVGGGAAWNITKEFAPYGAALISFIQGDIGGASITADSLLGLVAGAAYDLGGRLRFGGELHLLYQTGLSLYGRYAF